MAQGDITNIFDTHESTPEGEGLSEEARQVILEDLKQDLERACEKHSRRYHTSNGGVFRVGFFTTFEKVAEADPLPDGRLQSMVMTHIREQIQAGVEEELQDVDAVVESVVKVSSLKRQYQL